VAATVLIPTRRSWYRIVSAGAIYDLEEAFRAEADVDLLELPPYTPRLRARELRHRRIARPVQPPRGGYDLCFFPIFEPSEVAGLKYVAGLERCRRVIVYVFDSWLGRLGRRPGRARLWERVDEVIVSFPWAVDAYARATGKPVRYLPQAIDPQRFRPDLAERPIDVLSLGRRVEAVHRGLKEIAQRNDLWYHFSDTRSASAIDLGDSQRLVGELSRRARVQVCWPVEVTHRQEPRRGYRAGDPSPITARWFEAAASASVVVGAKPTDAEFDRLFPYDGFVRELDPQPGAALEPAVLDAVRSCADDDERLALAEHVRAHHSWAARCRAVLDG
jgi:hypothetical protein